MQIDIDEGDISTAVRPVNRIRSAGIKHAAREAVAEMMAADADLLESRWCERLKGSVWAPRRDTNGGSGGPVSTFLEDYCEAIGQDLMYAIPTPDAGTDGWISGSDHHRVETAYRIAVLSMGRDVIEEYLNEDAFPSLDFDMERQDELLDDLEAAYRLLVHQHIQQICDWLLRVTRLGLRTGAGQRAALR